MMLSFGCRQLEDRKILLKAHEESLIGKDQEIARLKEQSFRPYEWNRAGSKDEFGSSRTKHCLLLFTSGVVSVCLHFRFRCSFRPDRLVVQLRLQRRQQKRSRPGTRQDWPSLHVHRVLEISDVLLFAPSCPSTS